MAKVFDLVHKVSDHHEESRIPFEDDEQKGEEPAKKKRIKVEVVFFYLLLFAVFFTMGAVFIAPSLFTAKTDKSKSAGAVPSPESTPLAGFTVDEAGKPDEEIAKVAAGATPAATAPTNSASPASTASAAPAAASAATPAKAASIQILNGTNITGAAAALQSKLSDKGIVVHSIGNYKKRTVAKTTIYFKPDYRKAAQEVLSVSGGIMIEANSAATTPDHDVLVIIGQTN